MAPPKGPTLTRFTPDAAGALGGPAWLRERRGPAAEAFAAATLPSTDDEVWRYSRVDELDLDAYAPAVTAPSGADTGASPALSVVVDAAGPPAATVLLRNGHVVHAAVRADLAARGLSVGPAGDGDADVIGGVVGEAADAFTTLSDAFTAEPVVVRVPAGMVVDAPVVVSHLTEGVPGPGGADAAEGLRVATFPRLAVVVGDDAEVAVVEIQASDGAPSLVVPITELVTGRAARLGHVTVQQLGMATWQVGLQASSLGAESTLRSTSVAFGGDYARLRTDCRMLGRGATGELDAVFFGEAAQTLDFRTFQNHVAPDCTSNLLFKGAVGGRSRSVYTGMIHVGKDARGTNAFQTNRNVKLSDGAWAESVPNLVIENNDVRCSHASAVGPVDEEQRFYLESRGVPTDEAERLIVTGFFDEVLTRLPVPSLAPVLRGVVGAKFARREVEAAGAAAAVAAGAAGSAG